MKTKVDKGGYIRTIPLGIVKVKRRILTRAGKIAYIVTTKDNPEFEWYVQAALCICPVSSLSAKLL